MRHSMVKLFFISSLLFSLTATIGPLKVMAQEENNLGEVTYEKWCAGCHGTDGNSANPQFPILAGQYPEYLIRALMDYKSGARNNPIMKGMAAGLSPDDMRDLAAYFSSQPSALSSPTTWENGRRTVVSSIPGRIPKAGVLCTKLTITRQVPR